MNLSDLCAELGLKTVIGEIAPDAAFEGVYTGDLLSRAMSHVRAGNLWITIMVNPNVVAVASLTEAAAVILAEGVELLSEAADAARENGILILSSELSAYELCTAIREAQKDGV